MNRAEFINLLENKVQINRQMLGEVYELLDIFPYFQSAHMILLRGLKHTEDIKFEKQLRISSIHIADREVLYYFLNSKTEPVPVTDIVSDASRESEGNGAEHLQTVIETAMNSEELISDLEKNERKGEEVIEPPDLPIHSHSILISDAEEGLEPVNVMMVTDDKEPADDYSVFYMDPGFSVPESDDLLELDTSELNLPDSTIEDESERMEVPDEETEALSQSELIDRFILANPRIEPVRDQQDIPLEDITKSFAQSEGEFVTETLARIYINQGYYSKAIDIYEKLSLKFPEKSSYFASLIELVKVHFKK
jgi:hypothetical protein